MLQHLIIQCPNWILYAFCCYLSIQLIFDIVTDNAAPGY